MFNEAKFRMNKGGKLKFEKIYK